MTLSFQTKWPERMGELAKQPNYFVEKILTGLWYTSLLDEDIDIYISRYLNHIAKQKQRGCLINIYPKLHTIREDNGSRWKEGNKIHFVINNRTKNRFQFAPIIKCLSIQEIKIIYTEKAIPPSVFIDKRKLDYDEIKELAINDGFPSVNDFCQYFNVSFEGKIIHWTNLKY